MLFGVSVYWCDYTTMLLLDSLSLSLYLSLHNSFDCCTNHTRLVREACLRARRTRRPHATATTCVCVRVRVRACGCARLCVQKYIFIYTICKPCQAADSSRARAQTHTHVHTLRTATHPQLLLLHMLLTTCDGRLGSDVWPLLLHRLRATRVWSTL